MKIELYLVSEDIHGKAIKKFLEVYKIPFKEIITNEIDMLSKIAQMRLQKKISLLQVKYSHSIHVMVGFIEHDLNQLLEHIKKYKPKIE